jgi:hypothetical protein
MPKERHIGLFDSLAHMPVGTMRISIADCGGKA